MYLNRPLPATGAEAPAAAGVLMIAQGTLAALVLAFACLAAATIVLTLRHRTKRAQR